MGGCGAAPASYPRASLPTGSLTNATLVSGAFPQEVASALATHGVAPVTPVAYEQATMDGHLGAGEAPYPRVSSHAQALQTNQLHQSEANVNLSAIAHKLVMQMGVALKSPFAFCF